MKTIFNFLWVGYGGPNEKFWNREALYNSYNRMHIPINGQATAVIGSREYKMTVGNMYLLPSHSKISFRADTPNYRHLYVDFYVSPFILDEEVKSVRLEEHGTLESFATLFLRLMEEEGNNKPIQFNHQAMPRYLEHFIKSFVICFMSKADVQLLQNHKLADAISYIYANYDQEISNESIAKAIYIHPRHLTRIFNEELKMTPHQFLTEYRINMAMNMLEEGAQVKDACYRCGFQNLNAFRQAFKRMNYVTPSGYIRRTKKE